MTMREKAELAARIAEEINQKADGEEFLVISIVISLIFGKNAPLFYARRFQVIKESQGPVA